MITIAGEQCVCVGFGTDGEKFGLWFNQPEAPGAIKYVGRGIKVGPLLLDAPGLRNLIERLQETLRELEPEPKSPSIGWSAAGSLAAAKEGAE